MGAYKTIKEYILENSYENKLTFEEEKELFIEYREKNNKNAKNEILFRSIRLSLESIRKRSMYLNTLTEEDLLQQSSIIILDAINKFDYKKGVKFSTYICPVIASKLSRYIMEKDKLIRLSVNLETKFITINKVIRKLNELEIRNFKYEDIKKHTNITKKDYEAYLKYNKPMFSLDYKSTALNSNTSVDNETGLLDVLSTEENIEDDYSEKELLNNVLSVTRKLKEDDKNLIKILYSDGITQVEYSKMKNVNIKTIRKAHAKVINRYRIDPKIKAFLNIS